LVDSRLESWHCSRRRTRENQDPGLVPENPSEILRHLAAVLYIVGQGAYGLFAVDGSHLDASRAHRIVLKVQALQGLLLDRTAKPAGHLRRIDFLGLQPHGSGRARREFLQHHHLASAARIRLALHPPAL
jgi:hypothetical protein